MTRARGACIASAAACALAACDGPQSALTGSGHAALEIVHLWWAMFWGGAAVFALVLAALLYATLRHPDRRRPIAPRLLIVGGGIVLPLATLSVLLAFGSQLGAGPPEAAENRRIRIVALQWWWDIEYLGAGPAESFHTANELYLPVGEPVELVLESRDVIHSFWAPRLAGKMDLIPGRANRMIVQADRPGVYRGQCAEFCGLAHAKMAFHAVAVPAEQFEAWLARQRSAPPAAATAEAAAGAAAFLSHGCAVCHTVRGHAAWGRQGPDLTWIGERHTIGAGALVNTPENVALWIARNAALKPGNRMPDFDHLDLETRLAIAAYLEGLR